MANVSQGFVSIVSIYLFLTYLIMCTFGDSLNEPVILYVSSLFVVVLLMFRMVTYYKRVYLLSFFATLFMGIVFMLGIGVWQWGGDGSLLRLNKGARIYLKNGMLVLSAMLGILAFLSGQILAQLKVFNKNNILENKKVRIGTDVIWAALVGIYISSFVMLASTHSCIWIEPHLTASYDPNNLIHSPFFSFLLTSCSLMCPFVIDFAIRRNIGLRYIFIYIFLLSFTYISFGNRGGAVLVIGSYILLLLIHNKIKLRFVIFFLLMLMGSLFISFLAYLRSMAFDTSVISVINIFLETSRKEGFEYLYQSFPVVGQNLAHYSGYIYLFNEYGTSGFGPYLVGLLNILPRAISLAIGLPVSQFETYAYLMRNAGFVHTGGSYMFGEPYWLGGLAAVCLCNLIFGFIFMKIDLYFNKKRCCNQFLGHYIVGTLLMVIGFGYGFTVWIRAFYIVVIIEIIIVMKGKLGSVSISKVKDGPLRKVV